MAGRNPIERDGQDARTPGGPEARLGDCACGQAGIAGGRSGGRACLLTRIWSQVSLSSQQLAS